MKSVLLLCVLSATCLAGSPRFKASLDNDNKKQNESGSLMVETSSGYLIAAQTTLDKAVDGTIKPLWLVSLEKDKDGHWTVAQNSTLHHAEDNEPVYFAQKPSPEVGDENYTLIFKSANTSGLKPAFPNYWVQTVDGHGAPVTIRKLGNFFHKDFKRVELKKVIEATDGAIYFVGNASIENERCQRAFLVTVPTTGDRSFLYFTDESKCVPPKPRPSPRHGEYYTVVEDSNQHLSEDIAFVKQLSANELVLGINSRVYDANRNTFLGASSRLVVYDRNKNTITKSISTGALADLFLEPQPNRTNFQRVDSGYIQLTDGALHQGNQITLIGSYNSVYHYTHMAKPVLTPVQEKQILAKFDLGTSKIVWKQLFTHCSTGGTAELKAVTATSDGGTAVAGSCTINYVDPFLITRFTQNGEMEWSRIFHYNENQNDQGKANYAFEDSDRDIVAVGTIDRRDKGRKDSDVFVIKTDREGFIRQ